MRLFILVVALSLCGSSTLFSKLLFAEDHLALTRQFREAPPGESRPVLVRELLRQALLIAARDELGLGTSDEVLAAAVGLEAERLVLRPNLHIKADASQAEFGVYSADSGEPVWKLETKDIYTDIEIGVLSREMQKFSRNEFPALLSKLGLKANPASLPSNKSLQSNATKRDVEKQRNIRDLHNDFEIFPQCMAIQMLHIEIHEHGNDVELLCMLAKSYANLFLLTEPLVDGVPQAIAARALLYGDRVVDLFPDDVQARWSRGYAHALVGSLTTAEKDLDVEIKKQPIWAKIARHVVLFERAELDELMDKATEPYNKLAAFGGVLISEGNPISQIRLAALQGAEAQMPGNQRLLMGIFRETGPGVAAPAIEKAIASWRANIAEFKSSSTLPKPVTDAKSYRDFILQLEKSSSKSSNEFPNSAIARIIDDMNLLLNAALIGHYTANIGVDTSGMVNECRMALRGHRHWQLVELMRDFKQSTDIRQSTGYLERLANVRFLDVTPLGFALELTFSSWYEKEPNASLPHALTVQATIERTSRSAWEYLRFARTNPSRLTGTAWSRTFTGSLIEMAPHSPTAHAYWLYDRWEAEKSRKDEIRLRFKDATSIDWVIAHNARQEKDGKTAIESLERILEVSSDANLFWDLADTYKDLGDLDKWAETLERFLDFDSPDLKGGGAMMELANYHLKTKDDPLTALRYAKGAAQTGSAWGLQCLADVHVALGEWKEAEELIRAKGQRYSRPHEWYAWCLNFQQGDVEAAKKIALAHERKIIDKQSQDSLQSRFLIQKMAGLEIDKKLREDVIENASQSTFFLYVLFEFWEEKNLVERDRIAAMLTKALPKYEQDPRAIRVNISGRIVVDLLNSKASNEEAIRVFDEAIQANPKMVSSIGYFAGRYLELAGDQSQAIKYYEKSSQSGEGPAGGYTILFSKMRLRDLK